MLIFLGFGRTNMSPKKSNYSAVRATCKAVRELETWKWHKSFSRGCELPTDGMGTVTCTVGTPKWHKKVV